MVLQLPVVVVKRSGVYGDCLTGIVEMTVEVYPS